MFIIKWVFRLIVNKTKQIKTKEIFETMYYGAMLASYKQALEHGHYSSFKGSPLSNGKFQFDLWGC